ncbi:MAG: M23 family metallopeptidase [Clostridia bacterium]|nr:M23 family metallopeptidase [Clostridia bacterium]
MTDRNKNDNDKNPLEIPENTPSSDPKPIRSAQNNKTMKKVKYAYAFALLLALGTALIAKISTEKALGNLAPIESDYVTITTEKQTSKDSEFLTEEPDFEVRQNLEDVPDTREETEKQTEEQTEEAQEETTQGTKYATPYQDYYTLPLGTDILKDYSPDKPTYSATMGDWRTHSGIDFKAAEGEQVKAISYGTITDIYDDALWGTTVEIDHGNGVTAKYCGFNKDTLEIKKGATVEGGSLLGYLGTIPCEKSELSHLHFEVYYNGENVEPLELMGK